MSTKRFNIRVYGLCFADEEHIITSHETRGKMSFSKFPGGGLEFGEGLLDCLKRELWEEGRIKPLNIQHFYTTDFYQVSAFNPHDQLISVYYRCETPITWQEQKFSETGGSVNPQAVLRKTPLHQLKKEDLTFPIDQLVLEMLLGQKI